jgi:hypothetical protein
MMTPADVRALLLAHDNYFETLRSELEMNKRLYMTKFWPKNSSGFNPSGQLRTEVSKAYKVVESYVGSLYARNPSVTVKSDLRDRGNPAVAEAVANQYLSTAREQIEDATRLALIYPCSFLKLAPVENVDPLKRVALTALPPWEVIVDATAGSWDQQRYIGHVFLIPAEEAARKFNKREQDFSTRSYSRWMDGVAQGRTTGTDPTTAVDRWIRLVEMYDILSDKLLIWSPDYAQGKDFVFTGVTVQVGALPDADLVEGKEPEPVTEHVTTGIPFKSASGRAVVPILPLYFSRDPDAPLRGYSLISRSSDQFRELNVLRSYQANGVRTMARQWLTRPGFFSEEAAAKITQGVDGEIIEVDLQPGMPIEGNIVPMPQTPIPADVLNYAMTVEADINDSGNLAPFTRGEATGTTATEQNLLASYTSTEVGRMARIRDSLITGLASTYNIMLSVILGDDAEPLALPNPVGPTILSADDLTGDFRYWAVDEGTTPMNDFANRQTLERLVPQLLALGADPTLLLAELARVFQLPQALGVPKAPEQATLAQPGEGPSAPAPLMPTPEEVL